MPKYFSDIAPTLAKRSKLRLKFPVRTEEADTAIVVPSDPQFDANAGSGPVVPGQAIGGAQDGRVYMTGGYPAAGKGAIIGTPGAGTHSLGNWESDNAVDIGVKTGTPILATQDGVISKTFVRTLDPSSQFAGYQVHLGTGDNEWFYTHLSRIAKGIKPGARVKKGQVIGYGGAANGVDHLHLGVKNGNPLDLLGLRK